MVPRERLRTRHFALALEGAPAADVSLAALTRVAGALGTVGGGCPAPSDDFRAALRERLIAAAPQVRPVRGVPQPAPWRRRLVAASAVLAISTGGAAVTAVASTGALPGDRLYEVKRAVEFVQLALAPSDLAKGERYLAIASTRLAEVHGLLEESGGNLADPILVETLRTTLSDMSDAIAAGSERYFAVYQRTLDSAVLLPLEQYLQQRSLGLAEVRALLPAELLDKQGSMMVELDRIARRVATATGREPVTTVVDVPTSLTAVTTSTIASASRSQNERDVSTLKLPVDRALRVVGATVGDVVAAAQKAAAQSAAAAKPADDGDVEKKVGNVVAFGWHGQDGRVQGARVDFPGRAGAGDSSIAVSVNGKAVSSASSRLLAGMLPVGSSAVDAIVSGALSDLDTNLTRFTVIDLRPHL